MCRILLSSRYFVRAFELDCWDLEKKGAWSDFLDSFVSVPGAQTIIRVAADGLDIIENSLAT